MINWFNMPSEGLSNGGQFEIKELTATENRTYEKDGEVYNKVTVNVSGGGGSSDFSTAEVTFVNNTGDGLILYPALSPVVNHEINNDVQSATYYSASAGFYTAEDITLEIGTATTTFVFKSDLNFAIASFDIEPTAVSGNAEISYLMDDIYEVPCVIITGDCSITFGEESPK